MPSGVVFAVLTFCPFCGAALEPRFTIEESNLFGWYVWHKGKVVKHFEFKYQARGYIDGLLFEVQEAAEGYDEFKWKVRDTTGRTIAIFPSERSAQEYADLLLQ